MLVKIVVNLCHLLLKIGIFKESCKSAIASYDLGYSSSEYERKNYGKVASVLRKYIDVENDYCHGSLKYTIGLLYFYGHGIEKDPIKAEKLFFQAAVLGCDSAREYISEKSKHEGKHTVMCKKGKY